MANPVVSRPAPSIAGQENVAPLNTASVARYAKWIVLGVVILGVAVLIVATAVTLIQENRLEHRRAQWDELYLALKDQDTPEKKIAALETVAEKIKGSPAHGYVLMRLGDLYFERVLLDTLQPEQRAEALKKAQDLYLLVATSEPYRSNLALGPVAVESAARAYEQATDYDNAIKILQNNNLQANYLTNKLGVMLARLYYLRSLKETAKSLDEKDKAKKAELEKAAADDLSEARSKIESALVGLGAAKGTESTQNADFVNEAKYLKSLVDKPGKALPNGEAPPVKMKTPAPAAVGASAQPNAPAAPAPAKAVAPVPAHTPAPAQNVKKDEPKKDEAKPH